MKRNYSKPGLLITLTALVMTLLFSLPLYAQKTGSPVIDSSLYKEIMHMDSVLFDAFNSRKLEVIKEVFDKDLEFYHDKGGLTRYTDNIAATKSLFDQNNDLRRELVKGSTQIFPINGYGAIQEGRHKFCHTENGKPDCGTFKFVHIWQKKDNKWTLTRVISYDH